MTKRRVKGEGSVYRRKDGRVVGEYLDANECKRYITSKTKTKKEMKGALRKLLEDRHKGIAYDSENLTVGGYLDRWLDAVKGTVRDRTWQRHEEVVRLHLKPTIGRRREARQAERTPSTVHVPKETRLRAIAAFGRDNPCHAP
jgi:integrase